MKGPSAIKEPGAWPSCGDSPARIVYHEARLPSSLADGLFSLLGWETKGETMAQRGDEVVGIRGGQNVPRGAKCKCGNPATRKSVAEVPEASPRHLAAEQEGLDCIVHDSGGVAIQRLECDECFNRRTRS